jgi:serine/threonine protein kinase
MAEEHIEALELVGRYELVRRLGSGGMAEVHLARVSGLEGFEKLLVLKRILPHLSADPHFIKMFLAEARLAAMLDHPNVVQVFDLGYDDGDYFFTMEFVYGDNLQGIQRAARRARQRLPFEIAIGIGIGVASGLHYAHERVSWEGEPLGLVHRDVSPTNVMVTYDGCVKVADFGIAKVTNRTDVTRAGMRKGKVPYMSPEQCRAEKLDRRSDVFSLGIVLYECTTGRRLFDGDNEFGVMNRIVNGDVPLPSNIRPGYPKDLERIVMKALAVDKNRRYATAREMQQDLERLARERKLDVAPGAISQYMHQLYNPHPYPWGALFGESAPPAPPSLQTNADAIVGTGSGPGIPDSSPEVTGAEVSSWVPPSSHPSYPSANQLDSIASISQARREGQLRGLAVGLVSVAAVAALSVGGLFVYKSMSEEPASAAPAAVEEAPADVVAPPVEDADDEQDASDAVPGEPPAQPVEAEGGGEEPKAEDEDEDVPEDAVVVVEDDRASSKGGDHESKRGSKSRDKDKGSKTKKSSSKPKDTKPKPQDDDKSGDEPKKPNLDSFLPQ